MNWRDMRDAPATGTVLAMSEEVAPVMSVRLGAFPLIVARTALGLRAWVNACPHQYLPFDFRGPNVLSADGTRLLCSNHGAAFDIATGQGGTGSLTAVPVEEVDGDIRIADG